MLTVDHIMALIKRDKEIYGALSPEEKAEVDEYNRKAVACGGDIGKILKLGDNPMKRFRERSGG